MYHRWLVMVLCSSSVFNYYTVHGITLSCHRMNRSALCLQCLLYTEGNALYTNRNYSNVCRVILYDECLFVPAITFALHVWQLATNKQVLWSSNEYTLVPYRPVVTYFTQQIIPLCHTRILEVMGEAYVLPYIQKKTY